MEENRWETDDPAWNPRTQVKMGVGVGWGMFQSFSAQSWGQHGPHKIPSQHTQTNATPEQKSFSVAFSVNHLKDRPLNLCTNKSLHFFLPSYHYQTNSRCLHLLNMCLDGTEVQKEAMMCGSIWGLLSSILSHLSAWVPNFQAQSIKTRATNIYPKHSGTNIPRDQLEDTSDQIKVVTKKPKTKG